MKENLHVADEIKDMGDDPTAITDAELRRLNRNDYETLSKKFNTAFVLRHRRTGKIVELRAATALHACTLIGWKPKQVVVLKTKTVDVKA